MIFDEVLVFRLDVGEFERAMASLRRATDRAGGQIALFGSTYIAFLDVEWRDRWYRHPEDAWWER